jgi:hypothetical protein
MAACTGARDHPSRLAEDGERLRMTAGCVILTALA